MVVLTKLQNHYKCAKDVWEQYQKKSTALGKDRHKILSLRNRHQGKTIICMGNGPSLDSVKETSLLGFPIIATNRAYSFFSKNLWKTRDNFIIVNDSHRCLELLPQLPRDYFDVIFSSYDPKLMAAVLGYHREHWIFANYRWRLESTRGLHWIPDTRFRFSTDFQRGYYGGYSVIFSAIQLAYYLGARTIVLVGVDMNYDGQRYFSGITSSSSQLRWKGFSYERHAREHFMVVAEALRRRKVRLVDATRSGKVDVLEKVDLHDL